MAGGIYTGEEAAYWISRGLQGVQMATRFVTTEECDAHPAFKQTYIDAGEEDIVLVKSPVGTILRMASSARSRGSMPRLAASA